MTYMQHETDDGTVLRWHGGEYIEIGAIEGGAWVANDVLNWDYEKGAPRIPRTLDAFRSYCEEWLAHRHRFGV